MDNNNRQAWLVWVNLSPLRLNSLWPPESLVQWPSTSVRTPAWQKYITAYQYPPKCCWQILSKYINFSMKWCDKQKLHWLRDAEPIESQSTIIKKFILSSQILSLYISIHSFLKTFISKNTSQKILHIVDLHSKTWWNILDGDFLQSFINHICRSTCTINISTRI